LTIEFLNIVVVEEQQCIPENLGKVIGRKRGALIVTAWTGKSMLRRHVPYFGVYGDRRKYFPEIPPRTPGTGFSSPVLIIKEQKTCQYYI